MLTRTVPQASRRPRASAGCTPPCSRLLRPALLALLGCACLAAQAPQERGPAPEEARRIIDHVDRILRGDSSRGSVEMLVVTPEWKRLTRMIIWSEGADKVLIRVGLPKKDEGTATLRAGGNIWNYLPKIDRVIRVPTSMMMASWMGSHLTNDDLVKESRMIDDYDITIGFEGERAGAAVWEFVLTPKPAAPVVWGRVEMQVRQADLMPTWARYYDERGNLVRTMSYSEVRSFGSRRVPTVMTVRPEDKPDERTTVRYRDLEFDVRLSPDFFSLRNLQVRR